LLVGTKCDLEEKRQVSKEEAQLWANQFEDCSVMEVSAKLTANVEEIFQKLLQQILKAEQNKPKVKEEEFHEEEPVAAPPPPSPGAASTPSKSGKSKKDPCVVQ
jgi:GTPase SAR1 family protein